MGHTLTHCLTLSPSELTQCQEKVEMEEYSPDLWTLTDERLLATVSDDSDLYLQKMPGNCRNISDEVFPGIHVGDQ